MFFQVILGNKHSLHRDKRLIDFDTWIRYVTYVNLAPVLIGYIIFH